MYSFAGKIPPGSPNYRETFPTDHPEAGQVSLINHNVSRVQTPDWIRSLRIRRKRSVLKVSRAHVSRIVDSSHASYRKLEPRQVERTRPPATPCAILDRTLKLRGGGKDRRRLRRRRKGRTSSPRAGLYDPDRFSRYTELPRRVLPYEHHVRPSSMTMESFL